MAVGPIHHRGDGEAAGEWDGCGGDRGHGGVWVGEASGRSLSGLGRQGRRGIAETFYRAFACND
jgi:hypothetical protein